MATELKPSNFSQIEVWDSVFGKSEYETIIQNVLKILKANGNKWRTLPWEEYRKARISHGAMERNLANEKRYFDRVLPYTVSPNLCKTVCKAWSKVSH